MHKYFAVWYIGSMYSMTKDSCINYSAIGGAQSDCLSNNYKINTGPINRMIILCICPGIRVACACVCDSVTYTRTTAFFPALTICSPHPNFISHMREPANSAAPPSPLRPSRARAKLSTRAFHWDSVRVRKNVISQGKILYKMLCFY